MRQRAKDLRERGAKALPRSQNTGLNIIRHIERGCKNPQIFTASFLLSFVKAVEPTVGFGSELLKAHRSQPELPVSFGDAGAVHFGIAPIAQKILNGDNNCFGGGAPEAFKDGADGGVFRAAALPVGPFKTAIFQSGAAFFGGELPKVG